MTDDSEIDTTVAHSARVYDYWLGGKDNFPADRAMAEAVIAAMPSIVTTVRANRTFLGRAVRYLAADAGIRQFLDIGTGLPTFGNVHDVAQAVAPESRVVYSDYDPIVLAHAQALLTSHPDGKTAYIQADMHDPERVLSDPAVVDTLDLSQPVGLILVGVLMFLPDERDPYGTVRRYIEPLASGSYVVITHLTGDWDPVAVAGNVEASRRAAAPLQARSRDEVAEFFTGLELVEPGLVRGPLWRPETAPPAGSPVAELPSVSDAPGDLDNAHLWAGVARKP